MFSPAVKCPRWLRKNSYGSQIQMPLYETGPERDKREKKEQWMRMKIPETFFFSTFCKVLKFSF